MEGVLVCVCVIQLVFGGLTSDCLKWGVYLATVAEDGKGFARAMFSILLQHYDILGVLLFLSSFRLFISGFISFLYIYSR